MTVELDSWSAAFTLRFLEAGAGTIERDDGFTDAKTVPFGILTQALSGRYELLHSDRRVSGPTGTVIFAPPHVPLVFRHYAPNETAAMAIRFVHFSFSLGGGLDLLSLLDPPDSFDGHDAATIGSCVEKLLGLPTTATNPVNLLAVRQQMGATILAVLSERAQLRPGALERLEGAERLAPLLRHIRLNLSEHLDIEGLAKVSSLSRPTLHRQFSTVMGVSPMEYVKHRRLDEAARRLLSDDVTVAALANESGFANPYHFSREFKLRFGASPAVYRRSQLFKTQ